MELEALCRGRSAGELTAALVYLNGRVITADAVREALAAATGRPGSSTAVLSSNSENGGQDGAPGESDAAAMSSEVGASSCEPSGDGGGLTTLEASTQASTASGEQPSDPEAPRPKSKKRPRPFDFSRFRFRDVAIHLMYEGEKYSGFAHQGPVTEATVEQEVFEAFKTVKLIENAGFSAGYSRCGRTDRGVSAFGQVLGFRLRSNFPEGAPLPLHPEDEVMVNGRLTKELNYCDLVNRVLPRDIRAIAWTPVTPGFSARFSCSDRRYRYFFARGNLDVSRMNSAAQKFVGDHDFRNLCKMDAANVSNFRRVIKSAKVDVVSSDVVYGGRRMEVCCLEICGQAFLWHMVRCLAAALMLVGAGLEEPATLDALMDTEQFPRRPHYAMAHERGLVLQECRFRNLRFYYQPQVLQRLQAHLTEMWEEAAIRTARLRNYLDTLARVSVRRADVDVLCQPTIERLFERTTARQKAAAASAGGGSWGEVEAQELVGSCASSVLDAGGGNNSGSNGAALGNAAADAASGSLVADATYVFESTGETCNGRKADAGSSEAAVGDAMSTGIPNGFDDLYERQELLTWADAMALLEGANGSKKGGLSCAGGKNYVPLARRATGKSYEERLQDIGGRNKERLERNSALRPESSEETAAFFELKQSLGNPPE